MTRTPQNHFWQQHFPAQWIVKGYDPFRIKQMLDMQAYRLAVGEENPLFLLVLDDIVSDIHLRYDEMLRILGYEGRHSAVCIIMTSQYPFAVPPGLR